MCSSQFLKYFGNSLSPLFSFIMHYTVQYIYSIFRIKQRIKQTRWPNVLPVFNWINKEIELLLETVKSFKAENDAEGIGIGKAAKGNMRKS